MSETPVRSALFMDRDESLGNSLDRWVRRALHVKVGNDNSEAIPVNIINGAGTDYFIDVDDLTTPNFEQTLMSFVVPVGVTLSLYQLKLSCKATSEYGLFVNSILVASGFLGAAHPTDDFKWDRSRECASGQTVTLKFTHYGAASTSNPSTKVRAHLQTGLI